MHNCLSPSITNHLPHPQLLRGRDAPQQVGPRRRPRQRGHRVLPAGVLREQGHRGHRHPHPRLRRLPRPHLRCLHVLAAVEVSLFLILRLICMFFQRPLMTVLNFTKSTILHILFVVFQGSARLVLHVPLPEYGSWVFVTRHSTAKPKFHARNLHSHR